MKALQVLAPIAIGLMMVGGAAGCDRQGEFAPVDMWNRSRLKTYEPIDFFPDRLSNRSVPPGTIARGQMFKADDALYRGVGADGRYVTAVPPAIIRDYASGNERNLLQRGQERYQIYCQMCHGYSGHGDGMVTKRGMVPPPDYRIKRLRDAPIGHFYDVIANGYGAMYSYASRVPMQDRWAIAAYVRRLQEVQPQIVPDVRYQRENSRIYNSSGMSSASQRNTESTVGLPGNQGSGSQVRSGQGGMPATQPKNPMQAMPGPGVMATPGLNDGTRAD